MASESEPVGPLLEAALAYAQAGWPVLPLHGIVRGRCSCGNSRCASAGKHPRTAHGLKEASVGEAAISGWWRRWPDANVGILTGAPSGMVVLDVDPRHGGDESLGWLELQNSPLPVTRSQATGGGGRHLVFQHPGHAVRNQTGLLPGLDVRGDGGYIVAPPSQHVSGRTYKWQVQGPLTPVPPWLLELMSRRNSLPRQETATSTSYARAALECELAAVRSAPAGAGNDQLNRSAFALGQLVGAGLIHESGVVAALMEAATPRRPEAEARATIMSGLAAGKRNPRVPKLATPPEQGACEETATSGELVLFTGKSHGNRVKRAAYLRADAGNAELFSRMHGEELRFDHRRRIWRVWAEHWWREDDDGKVWRLAKQTSRELFNLASRLEDPAEREAEAKWALKSMNRERLSNMLRLAENESPVTDAGDAWDSDPWLLGVRNGVVDLRTGQLRPGRREDRISKSIPLPYEPDAEAPRWHQLLLEVFGSDREMVGFVHRAAGYSATGLTREQCLFLCHGDGSNGKSTLLRTMLKTLGPYGCNAPFSTLEMEARTSIPEDVARLDGARLVTASETSVASRLNEARVKALTGDDPISACYKYGHWFTFRPVLKLWLAVNHKPRVADTSYAFWRRVRLIPFLQHFDPKAEPDLEATLAAEAPGILRWIVLGARFWQERGLDPPRAVTDATESYREESDVLAEFLNQCCEPAAGASVRAGALYVIYGQWCDQQGLRLRERLGSRRFGEEMTSRYPKEHDKAGWQYLGLSLTREGLALQKLAEQRAEKRAIREPL